MKTERLESACKTYEEDLVLYYYGESAASDRARVEKHIEGCARCRVFLDDLRGLLPHLAEAKKLPDSFWERYYREVMEKLAAEQHKKSWWKSFWEPLRPWTVPAFGTAAIAIFAFALVVEVGVPGLQGRFSDEVPREVLVDSAQLEFFKSMDMLESLSTLEALDGAVNETRTSQT
jgi:hypothetical protein